METLLSGMIVAFNLIVATFFLRFWRQTHERFFVLFASAFLIFALQRLLMAALGNPVEHHSWLYGLRVLGYLVIIAAIVDKNRARPPESAPTDLHDRSEK